MSGGVLATVVAAAVAFTVKEPLVMFGRMAVDNAVNGIKNSIVGYQKDTVPDDFYLPVYSLSPEEIFQGKILLFNVDFFGKPKDIYAKVERSNDSESSMENVLVTPNSEINGDIQYYFYIDDGKEVITSPQDVGAQLNETISKWYISLRNIGLVMMLIVLLYVGIRMLLSTIASDKAKYKQMLQDWLMGVAILFSIHYIMVFANVIVNSLTKVVESSVEKSNYVVVVEDKNDKIKEFIEEEFPGKIDEYMDDGKLAWPTNLMGRLRIGVQLAGWGAEYIGLAVCFIVLVMFTAFFVITYMKRVLYMAFLTLMAPLVAVTYPIDKLNDGQAQGFNKWFKEYIFNLLIQPLHLLLYYILVTSAFELAGTNVIYSLVAIGFMIPAEKILRGFFGFEKSATAPSMAAGAALGMGMAHAFRPKPPKFGGNSKSAVGEGNSDSSVDNSVGTKTSPKFDTAERMAALAGVKTENGTETADNDKTTENEDSESIAAELPDVDGTKQSDGKVTEESNEGIPQLPYNEPEEESKREIKHPRINKIKEKYKGSKLQRAINSNAARAWSATKQKFKEAPGEAIRVAGRIPVATMGATIGLASGIAQGDLGKTASNMAAGTATGAIVGNGVVGGIANRADRRMNMRHPTETPNQAYNRVRNSAKFDDIARKERMKKDIRELRKTMDTNGFSKNDIADFTKKGGDAEYLWNNSVQDNKQLMAAFETRKEKYDDEKYNDMSKDEKEEELKNIIATAKTSKEMGDGYKGIKARKWEKEWTKRFQENGTITDAKQAERAGKETVRMGAEFSKKMDKYR